MSKWLWFLVLLQLHDPILIHHSFLQILYIRWFEAFLCGRKPCRESLFFLESIWDDGVASWICKQWFYFHIFWYVLEYSQEQNNFLLGHFSSLLKARLVGSINYRAILPADSLSIGSAESPNAAPQGSGQCSNLCFNDFTVHGSGLLGSWAWVGEKPSEKPCEKQRASSGGSVTYRTGCSERRGRSDLHMGKAAWEIPRWLCGCVLACEEAWGGASSWECLWFGRVCSGHVWSD